MDDLREFGADERPDDMVAKAIGPEPDADLHGDPAEPPPPASDDDFGTGMSAVRPWRIAESLETLRHQINAAFPNRDKKADGGIGDAAHASRSSDHNPWVVDGRTGVVTARDFTHHPASGCDCNILVEAIRASRDPRVKYIIWNKRICSSAPNGSAPAWAWRAYTGKNGHTHHVHLSVHADKARFDSTAPWKMPATGVGAAAAATEPETSLDDAIANSLAALGSVGAGKPVAERLAAVRAELDALTGLHAEAGTPPR